jgi:exocyst complex component 4
MTESSLQPGQSVILASLMTDDRYNIANGTTTSTARPTHKSLVVADAFNVSVLIGPTLAFLDRVKQIMPESSAMNSEEEGVDKGFGGFLDDFVLRTFLPQLEDKVTNVFHQAVGGPFSIF